MGSGPYGITSGSDGNLWFTETTAGKIGRITPTGTIQEFSLFGFPNSPYGITSGPDGDLWFSASGCIGRITPTGTFAEFSIPSSNDSLPAGIISGLDGNLWYTEYSENKIGRLTP